MINKFKYLNAGHLSCNIINIKSDYVENEIKIIYLMKVVLLFPILPSVTFAYSAL